MGTHGWAYRRRQPEGTVLYEAVRDYLATLLAAAAEVDVACPRYVERDFAWYCFMGARLNEQWRHAQEVLSTVLSGQGGRLFLELRDKRSVAYSVSNFTIEGVDPGYFSA